MTSPSFLYDIHKAKIDAVKREIDRSDRTSLDKNVYYNKCLPHLKANVPWSYLKLFFSGPVEEKNTAEFDVIDEKVDTRNPFSFYKDILNSYIENLDSVVIENGYSFIFYGRNSTGKTHTALHLLSHAIQKDLSGQYINFRDFIMLFNDVHFRSFEDEQKRFCDFIMNCDFLVIDELGKENATDNVRMVLESLIKHRLNLCKPTIFVTNFDFARSVDGKKVNEFKQQYRTSIWHSIREKYRVFAFSGRVDYRSKNRKGWNI